MLISIIGSIGSGKTLLCVIIASKSKRKTYSNFQIDINTYNELEIIDLLDLPNNIIVVIDEAYTWLESRTSLATLNRYLSYIIFQSRKRTLDVITTSQMFSSVDIRFREQSNIIVHCKRVDNNFHYTFKDIGNRVISTFVLPLSKAKKYFKLYDTYEIVEPNQKQELEFTLLQQYPNHLLEKVKEIAEVIKGKVKKITHDSIKASLMLNGYNTKYEKYIYLYLKEGLTI